MPPNSGSAPASDGANEALAAIRATLERLRFGTIAITVHEGRVVQLDITEKRRLAR
ncbi:YezD family protein [Sphingosinicella terrae]|jgi:hypothetical protein|uniref:YezD family protein n=1 Tax=Sphingosinicella terrae TaxID=2172047 RepID=UPI000E0D799B|nr:YezD family protein [Sphingosinicella terrae]